MCVHRVALVFIELTPTRVLSWRGLRARFLEGRKNQCWTGSIPAKGWAGVPLRKGFVLRNDPKDGRTVVAAGLHEERFQFIRVHLGN